MLSPGLAESGMTLRMPMSAAATAGKNNTSASAEAHLTIVLRLDGRKRSW